MHLSREAFVYVFSHRFGWPSLHWRDGPSDEKNVNPLMGGTANCTKLSDLFGELEGERERKLAVVRKYDSAL